MYSILLKLECRSPRPSPNSCYRPLDRNDRHHGQKVCGWCFLYLNLLLLNNHSQHNMLTAVSVVARRNLYTERWNHNVLPPMMFTKICEEHSGTKDVSVQSKQPTWNSIVAPLKCKWCMCSNSECSPAYSDSSSGLVHDGVYVSDNYCKKGS